jgi:hypothetical protein
MRDYAIVTPAFWIGETGKLLRGHPEAQILALYLMTCPHSTMTGVFHCPVLYMAHETGMGMEGASKGLERLLEVGFCEYDTSSECVFVVRMASFQIAETLKPEDNRHKGLLKELSKMTPAILRSRFIATYSIAFSLPKTGESASPSKAPPKPRTGTGTGTGKEPDKSGSSRPAKKCPESFVIPVEVIEAITEECPLVDIDQQTKIFRDHTFNTAKTDWVATWRNWMRTKQERLVEAGKKPGAPKESFAERDERLAAERFREATGQTTAKPMGEVIDITPIRIAK